MRWLALLPHVRSGRLRALALAGRGRFCRRRLVAWHPLARESQHVLPSRTSWRIRSAPSHRSRHTVRPEEPGPTLLTGEALAISVVPVGINSEQLASRHSFTVAMKMSFTDTHTQDVWPDDSPIFMANDLQSRSNGRSAATFLDQSAVPGRIATDAARTPDRHPRGLLMPAHRGVSARSAQPARPARCIAAGDDTPKAEVAGASGPGGPGPAGIQRGPLYAATRRWTLLEPPTRSDDGRAPVLCSAERLPQAREQGRRSGARAARSVCEGSASSCDGRLRVRVARHAAPHLENAGARGAGRGLRHHRGHRRRRAVDQGAGRARQVAAGRGVHPGAGRARRDQPGTPAGRHRAGGCMRWGRRRFPPTT